MKADVMWHTWTLTELKRGTVTMNNFISLPSFFIFSELAFPIYKENEKFTLEQGPDVLLVGLPEPPDKIFRI